VEFRTLAAISACKAIGSRLTAARGQESEANHMMNALPALIVIWAVFTGIFLALLAYNATLTRYEENQLFLEEINANQKQFQTTIVRRIQRTLPYIRAMGWVSAVMTVAIVAIYTWDAWQKLQQ
jgi:hypothetical protein